jgi:hypothetical protein
VALPSIDDLDRHLGGLEVVQPHVASDPDRHPGRRRERDQRLVVPVVDVEQVAELTGTQDRLGREVALVARAFAQMAEHERQRVLVGAKKLADRDHRHPTPVTTITPHM